jgi:translocator protein
MQKHTPSRWFALIMVVINIIFNYFTSIFSPDGRSIREISDQYPNLFSPAPYAFSILGVIYLSVLIYAVVQVLPRPKNVQAYNELAFPLAFLSLLGMCWILSFLNDFVTMSELVILAMLITSSYAFKKAKGFAFKSSIGLWAVVPFSLYTGWLSVATLANTSTWIAYMGWNGAMIGEANLAIIMLVIAILLGVIISFRYRDIVYPLVIAWGIVSIWANWQSNGVVGTTALTGGIMLVVVALFNMLRNDFINYSRKNKRRRHVFDQL